jgi:hypothetical protein
VDLPVLLANRVAQIHATNQIRPVRKILKVGTTRSGSGSLAILPSQTTLPVPSTTHTLEASKDTSTPT